MDVCAGSPANGFEHRAPRKRWGINTSHIRHGGLTGQGPAPLGKRLVRQRMGIVFSALRQLDSHLRRSAARPRTPWAPATVWGSRPRLSAKLLR